MFKAIFISTWLAVPGVVHATHIWLNDTSLGSVSYGSPAGLKIEPTEPKAKPKPASKPAAARKPKRKTTKPKAVVYSLTGTWDWVAVCPVVGRVTGATALKSTGSGAYSGSLKTSLKQRARVKAKRDGRDFVLEERYGLIKVTGQHRLSANGRSFSGRVNNGCTVTGKKR